MTNDDESNSGMMIQSSGSINRGLNALLTGNSIDRNNAGQILAQSMAFQSDVNRFYYKGYLTDEEIFSNIQCFSVVYEQIRSYSETFGVFYGKLQRFWPFPHFFFFFPNTRITKVCGDILNETYKNNYID